MPEQKTFARQAILNRIAEKSATQRGKQFQDYTEHTDYEAYTDYNDCHGEYYDVGYCDNNVTHNYSDVFYDDCAVDVPQSNKAPQKSNFFQKVIGRIFGSRQK